MKRFLKNRNPLLLATATSLTAISFANAQLLITEIHSDGLWDFWELTNVGASSVDISGYKWDDDSRNPDDASAVTIPNGTTIASGESIVFAGASVGSATTFRTAWNIPASVQVIVGGPNFGGGDGVAFFNASKVEQFFFSYLAYNSMTGAGFIRTNGDFSTGGHAGLSAGGTATQAMIWDSGSTTSPRYTNATGSNLGTFAASGSTTVFGSPGYSGFGDVTLVDLSTYVRVGRHSLPEPGTTALPPGTPSHNLLCQEASGVTYNWDTDTLFIVGDGSRSITQVSKTGQLIDTMTLALRSGAPQGTDFYDLEGITYIGNGEFVITEERDRQLVKITYTPGVTKSRADAQTVKIGTFLDNIGTEGLSLDPLTGGFIALREKSPIGVFQTTVDFAAGTASNGSPTTENSTNLFDTNLLGMTDVAGVFALSNLPSMSGETQEPNLLVLGQEDARVVNIDRSGNIHSSLQIVADPGSPISAPNQQHEGITMDRAGNIYIVSENGGGNINFPELWIYAPTTAPNLAPTGIALNNAVNSIIENTSTASPVKLADIVIEDDGLGTNEITLTGADAASFAVSVNSLFLKAGVDLDFETKTSYSVTIVVDDTSVGTTPDATLDFTLTVLDQEIETPPAPALIVTEVAPWSSGSSPVGGDWFEVTNVSENPVDVTGWKVDDSSNAFANGRDLVGITTIAPGESVIFIEDAAPPAKANLFRTNWFGASPPAALQIGSYTGAGIGLGTGGDAVNLYTAAGTLHSRVDFGASPAGPFATFDNTLALNDTALTVLSANGVNGAFVAANSATEIGSPGFSAPGVLRITEVAPWASGNSPVASDWFEVTNVGARAVSIIGWKVDDSSETPAAAVPLTGIDSIAPGESVIFMEATDLPAKTATFINTWFASNAPSGLQFGGYSGSGIGLSTGGDAVVLYNTNNIRVAKVEFGIADSASPYQTFDNAALVEAGTISLLSERNVNGAFAAINAPEIGSPGNIDNPPFFTPFTAWLAANGYTSAGIDQDSDDDGLTDGVEFFFNQNPNSGGDILNMPQIFPTVGGALELDFTRLTDTGSVSGVLQTSGDLETWTAALSGIDFAIASSVVNGDETAFTYSLPGTGPSAPGTSATYPTPNTSDPAGASLGGVRVVNEGLVGVGRLSGNNLDQFGETQGAASGLFITDWAWDGNQFNGTFQVLPDRGYNSGTIFSNYAARLHEVDFTFSPYYGAEPVAQGQIAPTYVSSTKFTYQDGATVKFTTGLDVTGTGSLFGESVGVVTAANGPGGAQESLLSFDAEAVHLFSDGSGFVSDEYGTYIARFNFAKRITGITQLPESSRPHSPVGTSNFSSTITPANGRRQNQGLEGMSVTPDGTRLFAVMQSALVQDTNGTNQQTRNNTRLFVYDVAGSNRETPVLIGQYVVKLPQFNATGSGGALNRTASQSEIVALNGTSFLMLPRDGNGMGTGTTAPIVFKSVQLVDFASATNILGTYDSEGAAVSPAGVLAPGVNAAASEEIINMIEPLDLAKFGLNSTTNPSNSNTINEKMEGMALVPDLSTPQANDFFLFLANDNDFQSSDVKMVDAAGNLVSYGDGRLNAGITNDAMFYAYRITIDADGKKFFRFEVK